MGSIHLSANQAADLDSLAPPQEIESALLAVILDAAYAKRLAEQVSRTSKSAVVVVCNARNGTFPFFAIENSAFEAEENFQRNLLARAAKTAGSPEGMRAAVVGAATDSIKAGEIGSFVYPLLDFKVASLDREAKNALFRFCPEDWDALLSSDAEIVVLDYSLCSIPGSFRNYYTKVPKTPLNREGLENIMKNAEREPFYVTEGDSGSTRLTSIKLGVARRSEALEREYGRKQAILVNLDSGDNGTSHSFTVFNNEPAYLGDFGYSMGADHQELYRPPAHVRTTEGIMRLDSFVRSFLRQSTSLNVSLSGTRRRAAKELVPDEILRVSLPAPKSQEYATISRIAPDSRPDFFWYFRELAEYSPGAFSADNSPVLAGKPVKDWDDARGLLRSGFPCCGKGPALIPIASDNP